MFFYLCYFYLFHKCCFEQQNSVWVFCLNHHTSYHILFYFFIGCLQPSAAAAWRKSPPQSLWCVLWSASTTWTAFAAACATASWGRATSLFWRRVSCFARLTTRGRKTYSARSARMTQTQVSLLHPLTQEWERHCGAIVKWHQGVVFCMLCPITAVATLDVLHEEPGSESYWI